ncbi:MAG: glycosyltransferase family 2 protein [Saprospiraceae bacterium]|nr:glycosyltransferase family 2 protein [Saprospiraceae bacterium]
MESSIKISTVIITYNEEKHIARCLASVEEISDEILVVDSHSTDRTVEIAKEMGAMIILHEFVGHIEQKNFGVQSAQHDYVLSIDADEMLSIELIRSIVAEKSKVTADAYRLNRLNNFCGKWIKHGLWYPDRKIRLWDRRKGDWGGENPHDKVILTKDARLAKLDGDLLHYTVSHIGEYIGQINTFSSIQAEVLKEKKVRATFFHLYLKPAYKFFLAYFFKLGFLDGWRGFCIAAGQAWGIYLRYIKMKEYQS